VTFSLLARDPSTGAFGMALSSSSPAVAARCLHLRPGIGGAASQNITDPRIGEQLLDLMASGNDAVKAIALLIKTDPTIAYRQITAVDANGGSATFSGDHVLGINHRRSETDVAAAGNMLATPQVIDAMIETFLVTNGDFEVRLLSGLKAGLDAGGELGPLQSAGLKVTGPHGWAITDLRVDSQESPIAELVRLWDLWSPQRWDYQTRGIDPSAAPSYGVPGDE